MDYYDYGVLYADSPEQERAFEAKGMTKCVRCGGFWFAKEDEGSTCPKCWAEVMEKD